MIAANTSRDIQITGLGGVPTSSVLAVVVDLSVVSTTSDGWGLLWESGTTRPIPASSINYVPGRAVTNAATSKVSAAGKVSYYTYGSPADVIVDIVGYYRPSPGAAGYVPVTQTRILDTRDLGAKVAAGSTLDRKLRGVAGIPDSSDVTAVALNMSAFNQEGDGYITVYPRGQARPGTSSLNYAAWRMQTQMVLAPLSSDGWASFFTAARTDLLFDVVGYYTKGSGQQLVTLTPQRVIDTRYAFGMGVGPITQALAPNTHTAIKLTGVAGVPETGVTTVLINATADAGSTSAGWLSFWPSGETLPGTVSLTYYPNEDTANLVMAKVGTDGKVMVTNYTGTTHLILDVVGYFIEPTSGPTTSTSTSSTSTSTSTTTSTTTASPPSQPLIGPASSTSGAVSVEWSAPSQLNGSVITGYIVTATPFIGDGIERSITLSDPSARSATVTGVTNGTTYRLTVTATSNRGNSPPSEPSNATTPKSTPDQPTASARVSGDAQATVTWLLPRDNGSRITGYRIEADPALLSGPVTIIGADNTSATVDGLTNGTRYTFAVTANSDLGDSAPGTSNPVWALANLAGGAKVDAFPAIPPPGETSELYPCLTDESRFTCRRSSASDISFSAASVRHVAYYQRGAVSGGGNYLIYVGEDLYEGCSYLETSDEWHCTHHPSNYRHYETSSSLGLVFGPAQKWAVNQAKIVLCVDGFATAFRTGDSSYIVNNCA